MKVVVTGGSGFVGRHLTDALLTAGHTVRALSRHAPAADRRKAGVEYVDGVDVGDARTLTAAMFDGVDAIVHLVGIIIEGKGGQTFQRIHVEGARNLVEAAHAAGFQGRFITMSAIGASADAPAEYSRTKHAAEQIVIQSGFPYTIFRPSLIMGWDGEFVAQMADLIKHGGLPFAAPVPVIPVPGSGKNRFQPIHIDDLTSCVVKSLSDPATANQVYEVGGGSQVTFNELLAGFARSLNVRKPMVHAPIPILMVAATVMEKVMSKPPVTRDQLANLSCDNITESNAVADVFGVSALKFDAILDDIYRNRTTE